MVHIENLSSMSGWYARNLGVRGINNTAPLKAFSLHNKPTYPKWFSPCTGGTMNILKRFLKLGAKDAQSHYRQGRVSMKRGRWDEAAREFQAVLRMDPDNTPARFALAVVYRKQGRLDDAIREYQAVLRIAPDSARTHYNLALVHYQQGRVNEAIVAAQKALELGSKRSGDLMSALQRQSSSDCSQRPSKTVPRHSGGAYPKQPKLKSNVRSGYRASDRVSDDDDLLPSGYRRSEYHDHGAIDDDVEYWGLDQPGAPAPEDAGIAVWDVLDEMDADGDGFIDDPWDDPFS